MSVLNGAVNLVISGTFKGNNDLLKGALALRCAISTGGDELWRIIMAIYLTANAFSLGNYIQEGVEWTMPFICSCAIDIESYAQMFGDDAKTANAEI